MYASMIGLSLRVLLEKMYLPWSSMRVSEILRGTFLDRSIETSLDLEIGDVAWGCSMITVWEEVIC